MKLNRSKSKTKQLLHFIKWAAIGYIAITLLGYAGIITGLMLIAIAAYLGINHLFDRMVGRTVKNSVPSFTFTAKKA